MRLSTAFLLLIAWSLAPATSLAADTPVVETPVVDIGIVVDGPSSISDQLVELTQQEIRTLLQDEFEPRFADHHTLAGDWTLDGVRQHIQTLEEDPEVEIILALGVLASHLFCCEQILPKPVIAPLVIDAELQGLPNVRGTSGRPNLNYLAIPSSAQRDLDALHHIVPFRKVAFVANRWLLDAIPGLAGQMSQILEDAPYELVLLPVGESVEDAMAALPEDADAAYVAPILHLSEADRQRIIDFLKEKRLPSFSIMGTGEVERGLLAAQRSDDFFFRLSRRIALNVQRILLGEDPGNLPTGFADRIQLRLNMKTARRSASIHPGNC